MKKLNTFAGPGETDEDGREVVLNSVPRVSPDETHEQGGGGDGL